MLYSLGTRLATIGFISFIIGSLSWYIGFINNINSVMTIGGFFILFIGIVLIIKSMNISNNDDNSGGFSNPLFMMSFMDNIKVPLRI